LFGIPTYLLCSFTRFFTTLCIALVITACNHPGSHKKYVYLNAEVQKQATVHLDTINRLNEQGKYAEAILSAERLLSLVEDENGPDNRGVAFCHSLLGGLYNSFGDYDKALKQLTLALEISKNFDVPDTSLEATCLGLLSKVYMNKGQFYKAKPFAKRALELREQSMGDKHFMISTSLNTLGEIYLNLDEFDRAETLFLRAIEIRKMHQNTHGLVISLNNLCRLYYQSGYLESAEKVGQTSLELGTISLSKDHPHIADTLNLLGRIKASEEHFQAAFQYLKLAQLITDETIDDMKGFTSSSQKLKFIQNSQNDLHMFLSLILNHLQDSPEAVREGMNILLRRKGIILDMQKRFQEAMFASDLKTMDTFNRLSEVRSHLTRLTFSGPGRTSLNIYNYKISQLRDQKERLEIELSTRNQAYKVYLRKVESTCENVAAELKKRGNSALVELMRVRLHNFKIKSSSEWDEDHYFAFILLPGNPYKLSVADLGKVEYIDQLISQYKKMILRKNVSENIKAIFMADRLYSSVFKPISRFLNNQKTVYLSPDGNLNLIPFEVFHKPGARYLIEDYTFNYLSSGRDILGHGEAQQKGSKVILMGDPDFDYATVSSTEWAKLKNPNDPLFSSTGQRSILDRDLSFNRLPGTKEEVLTIQSLLSKWQSEVYTGKEASENILFANQKPRILHLATHGFFLKDIDYRPAIYKSDETAKEINFKEINVNNSANMKRAITNPFMQSGFVLAGANKSIALQNSDNLPGIVTAEKILSLNLAGTDMVVLSACNTGIGEVKSGEGVFGLRRAFTQVGAKSLVMSMWNVPDKETKELMIQFYKNICFMQMDRCNALRQAILNQKEIIRHRHGNDSPFYWGAFVFLGEA